jgi:hypothetical protein
MTPKISPASMSRLTLRTAWTSPDLASKVFDTSSKEMTVLMG